MAVLPIQTVSDSVQLQPAHRFSTLDALRGIAALLVVQVHLPFLFSKRIPFPNANLAVDFFFMLSGFVLSFAYGRRLEEGWPLRHFLRDRLIRLYPLYLLALPLGLARLLLLGPSEHIPLGHIGVAVLIALALLMLPAPASLAAGGPYAFPVNLPGWSLFYELLANVLHAVFLRRRSLTRLAALVGLLALSFFAEAQLRHRINFGPYKGELGAAVLRVALSYTYGMLLFVLWQRGGRFRLGSNPGSKPGSGSGLSLVYALGSAALLVAVLVFPPLPQHEVLFAAMALLVVFPCSVLLGANAVPHPKLVPLFSVLGTTSYAVYVFHVPLYAVYTVLWKALAHAKPADHAPFAGWIYLVFLVLFAYAADRFYDLPVRRVLRRLTR